MHSNEEYRFGSAAWADEGDLRRAGLLGRDGLQLGYFGNKPLRLEGDAPLITIGGAGSGKLRDLLAYVVCGSPGVLMLVNDTRGELTAISSVAHTRHGDYGYSWNPTGLCGLPQHGCNPLDILKPDSPNLFGDCQFIAEGLIPLSGGGNGKYFELRAREWLQFIMIALVERERTISFPRLYRIINMIESDPKGWADILEAMLASTSADVRRVASEMLAKQQDSSKEFGSIMGEIYAHLNFLADPVLSTSLERSDFSLAALISSGPACKIFLNVPAEYLSIWSPVLRVFFTVAMLYKSRAPQARQVTFLVDEAGQMGNFEMLLRSFTYGRGAGIRSWAVFQDTGQIVRNFGAAALQGFLGSAQVRQFFGVRDYQTAQMISAMLGTETLEYDDGLRQADARRQKLNAALGIMNGGDPFSAYADMKYHAFAEEHRTKQARALMTPDEILNMQEDRQILFISGKHLKPVLAHKYPYFMRREMAGRFLANPYHPPHDSAPIASRWGQRRARIITEPVPQQFAHYPQYASGTWSYVEGYRPS